ncbi:MAG: Crp/Fnr family transcriptional regulator [Verrucomicrobiales bacterium]|nr:Crp/Fnr family transcriptional regulator [Verrucomicrobiales bacterium]
MKDTIKTPNEIDDDSIAVKAIEKVITEHTFLRGLNPEHQALLADSAMRMHFNSGQYIFSEGDPANRFYLIESGKVSLESGRKDETAESIQILGPGDVLGWSWLFPPYYWHFDARVLEPTTAIFFYGTRLREQCEENHELGYELMKRMAAIVIERLQASRKQVLAIRKQPLSPK